MINWVGPLPTEKKLLLISYLNCLVLLIIVPQYNCKGGMNRSIFPGVLQHISALQKAPCPYISISVLSTQKICSYLFSENILTEFFSNVSLSVSHMEFPSVFFSSFTCDWFQSNLNPPRAKDLPITPIFEQQHFCHHTFTWLALGNTRNLLTFPKENRGSFYRLVIETHFDFDLDN